MAVKAKITVVDAVTVSDGNLHTVTLPDFDQAASFTLSSASGDYVGREAITSLPGADYELTYQIGGWVSGPNGSLTVVAVAQA